MRNIKNLFLKYYNDIDEEYLNKYLNIIKDKSTHEQKNEDGYSITAKHHILPKAKNMHFCIYKDLNKNKWNKSILLYKDHYYAHFLLCKIFKNKNYSMNEAFLYMHNSDIKLNRIKEDNLIDNNDYQELHEQANKIKGNKISEYRNTKVILEDGTITTNGMLLGKKVSKALNIIGEDGLTPAQRRAKGRNFISVLEISSGIKKTVSSEEYKVNRKLYKSTAKQKYSKEENIRNTIRQIDYKEIHIYDNNGNTIEIFDPFKKGSFRKWLKETNYPNNFYNAMNENRLACMSKMSKESTENIRAGK